MEFIKFPKMARLSREVIVTEKIDGTNACIAIDEHGVMRVGSRTRWITPENDNYGFARWAYAHQDELMTLGCGRHFGEWWGNGIQRGYGLKEKRFSLFNVSRWALFGSEPEEMDTGNPNIIEHQHVLPECVGLVPVLYRGIFNTEKIDAVLNDLALNGSSAAPGFMRPEGVVVFHVAGNVGFKKTIEKDEQPKSKYAPVRG